MQLLLVGADVWYVDESGDEDLLAVSTFSIPLLRKKGTEWHITWDAEFEKIRTLRRWLRDVHGVPIRKELHAVKLVSGRGRYGRRQQLSRASGAALYKRILSQLSFLPESSIITVVGRRRATLYGHTALNALSYALFQRMQRASLRKNGMTFFDEGHGEYLKIYRKARVFLPTGSSRGGWESGALSENKPMTSFFKDANFKRSQHSWYIQIADLVAYAAFLKAKARIGSLTAWQQALGLGAAYDIIPSASLNQRASSTDPQGIVWLGF